MVRPAAGYHCRARTDGVAHRHRQGGRNGSGSARSWPVVRASSCAGSVSPSIRPRRIARPLTPSRSPPWPRARPRGTAAPPTSEPGEEPVRGRRKSRRRPDHPPPGHDPRARHDLVLVYIQTGTLLMDDVHSAPPEAWRGAGDSTAYKACSGASPTARARAWTQYAVRHQLPVQPDDGLPAPQWWPISVPTPATQYSVSSVAVSIDMLNLTGH